MGHATVRRDVTFDSKGTPCVGWLFLPGGAGGGEKSPGIVMAHGFSGVKEMGLADYAELFAAAGFAVLAFDFRFLGESGGEPRQQMLPWDQREDLRNALTWFCAQPEVDAERVGLWGTSYSGCHVISVGAHDPRVKAVVNQANGCLVAADALRAIMPPEQFAGFRQMLLHDRVTRYASGETSYIPIVAPPGQPAAMNAPGGYEFFMEEQKKAPTWENRVTVETMEKMIEDDISLALEMLSPTPLLVILCERDPLIPVPLAEKAFARVGEPKRMEKFPVDHFDIYSGEWLDKAAQLAVGWFGVHLG